MDMFKIVDNIVGPIRDFLLTLMISVVSAALASAVLFLALFFIRYRINPFRLNEKRLRSLDIQFRPYDMLRYILVDAVRGSDGKFHEYGFTFYCGRQGAGKTIGMVHYLNEMKRKYPKCMIVTNFSYAQADRVMHDWRDFMTIRNGTDGVIFAIDEIHSEYSSAAWKDFPENLLSEISQQRKQCVKIVATSQVFSRIAKPLREQAFSVCQCNTYFGRYTRCVEYDANDYSICVDKLFKLKEKCRPISKTGFVQSDALRASYDTYEKIERMKKIDFIPRAER